MYLKNRKFTFAAATLAMTLISSAAAVGHAEEIYAPVGAATSPVTTIGVLDHFGKKGQFFVKGGTSLDLRLNHLPGLTDADTSQNFWAVQLAPAFGLFVHDFVFVQLSVLAGYNTNSRGTDVPGTPYQAAIGVAPGIGVNVPIDALVSFAPSLNVEYAYGRTSDGQGTISNTNALDIAVDLPFVFETSKHLSLTIGPKVAQNVLSKLGSLNGPHRTQVSIAGGVLGWW